MSRDKLAEHPTLPYDRAAILAGGESLAKYLRSLVHTLADRVHYEERTAINHVLGRDLGIVHGDIAKWDEAHAWGNHAVAGYLGPGHPAANVNLADLAKWNEAHTWGNHATAGYLTVETDPVFADSPAGGISLDDLARWNAAHGWGNHAAAGYLTAETDPVFTAWDKSTGIAISESQISDLQAYLTAETDPVFGVSPAGGITVEDIGRWDEAHGWGDHDGLYDPLGAAGAAVHAHMMEFPNHTRLEFLNQDVKHTASPTFAALTVGAASLTAAKIGNWDAAHGWGNHAGAGYLTTETDPVFGASPAAGITAGNISNWNTAHGWGNHSTQGYLKTETDPVFGASPASGITAGNISNWNTAHGWGNHAGLYDTAGTAAAAINAHLSAHDHTRLGWLNQDVQTTATPTFAGALVSASVGTTLTINHVNTSSDSRLEFTQSGFSAARIVSVGSTVATAARRDNLEIASTHGHVVVVGVACNLGVNDNSPADRLSVGGDIRASGVFKQGDNAGITNTAAGVPTALTIRGGIVTAVTKNDWLNQNVRSNASPTFTALTIGAASLTATKIGNWDTAHGWGNHAGAGYLTTETDPVFGDSPAAGITAGNISNWNTAHGWGNHAGLYDALGAASGAMNAHMAEFPNHTRLEFLNQDVKHTASPTFAAMTIGGASLTGTKIGNWDTAHGWGNHAGLYDAVGAAAAAVSAHESAHVHSRLDWLNQDVRTAAHPTFTRATLNRSTEPYQYIRWTTTSSFGHLTFRQSDSTRASVLCIGSAFSTTARRNNLELTSAFGDVVVRNCNLGVNVDSPAARLHVDGAVHANNVPHKAINLGHGDTTLTAAQSGGLLHTNGLAAPTHWVRVFLPANAQPGMVYSMTRTTHVGTELHLGANNTLRGFPTFWRFAFHDIAAFVTVQCFEPGVWDVVSLHGFVEYQL